MHATRLDDVEVLSSVTCHALHALYKARDDLARLNQRVVYHVEELNRQVILQVNDGILVQNVVEVELFVETVASEDEIFAENSLFKVGLVETELPIDIQVPGYDKQLSTNVLDE